MSIRANVDGMGEIDIPLVEEDEEGEAESDMRNRGTCKEN